MQSSVAECVGNDVEAYSTTITIVSSVIHNCVMYVLRGVMLKYCFPSSSCPLTVLVTVSGMDVPNGIRNI